MAVSTEVSKEEVIKRYEGDLSLLPVVYVETKILDAIQLIKDECPTAIIRLQSGTLSTTTYYAVVADIVLRVFRNPGGMESESEGGYSYRRNAVVASGNLWLTDRDKNRLLGILDGDRTALPGTVSIGLDSGWVR